MLPGDWAADAQRTRAVTIGAALAVALVGSGWTLESLPGAAPVLHRGAESVEPFGVVEELARGSSRTRAGRSAPGHWGSPTSD